jgi:hypothetical protein
MMCAYYPSERLLPCYTKNGIKTKNIEFSILKNDVLCAEIEVGEISRFSAASSQSILDKLFDRGFITPTEYVKRLPAGSLSYRDELLDSLSQSNYAESEETV